MALTLVDAQVLSKDVLQAGVIETIVRESSVLAVLPFQTIEGNAYSYNVEKALPTVEFRQVNEAYTASEAQFETRSENLVILGGDVELDRFIMQTLSNVNDQMAVQIAEKAKSIANTFTKTFFKGNKAVNPKEFDGIDVRIAGTEQEISADNSSDQAYLDKLNELLDAVRGGADALFMTKKTKRKYMSIFQKSQHYIEQGQDAFGKAISIYGGVPILTVEEETLPSATDATSGVTTADVYAVKFGAYTNVAGLTNGGVQVRRLGETSAKAVEVTRIEFFCGLAQFNPYSSAKLAGVKVN